MTPTGVFAITPASAAGRAAGSNMTSIRNDRSVACSTGSRTGLPVTAPLERGKSGATTTKPAAATACSSGAYDAADVPKPCANTTSGNAPGAMGE